ncbi:hypothetical protein LGQ02_02605 [Bacillus shivajii]|uniref:hypothetical protein n=1 Tax=Bacillus shivajii TaxID=1983719 RepID=UPI001CFA4D9D|nr:hypothetical protein [Bacillus shivajii]UCZ53696.1 hypothetical protein LGQ02_02605 [Bacillus shivajii]
MIYKGFKTLTEYTSIALYPIMIDFLSFMIAFIVYGFHYHSTISFKFSINPGLPSISDLLENPNVIHSVNFSLDGANSLGSFSLLIIFMFIFLAFIEGGFIGLLHKGARGEDANFHIFLRYGKKHWLDFIVVLIIQLALLFVLFIMMVPFMIPGIFFGMFLLFVLRILFIFWEFTIVTDELRPIDALKKSRFYFKTRIPETFGVIFSILIFNLISGLIINQMSSPIFYMIFIIMYGYVATGFQFALMHTFHESKKEGIPNTL